MTMQRVDHQAVLEALQTGESQNAVSRRLGVSLGSVNRIARLNAIPTYSWKKTPDPEEVVAAAIARAEYSLERRVALIDKVFAKAESMLDTATTPHKLQALAIALGILIDKRRLEDGEATSRTEIHGDEVRERLASRLDEFASRRRPEHVA